MFGRRRDLGFEPCTALTLRRVVPIAQRVSVGGITVALSALEMHEGGKSLLRYSISVHPESDDFKRMSCGLTEPELLVRDGSGRTYDVLREHSGAGAGHSSGELKIVGLPDTGDLQIEVTGVFSRAFREERAEYRDGLWTFQVPL